MLPAQTFRSTNGHLCVIRYSLYLDGCTGTGYDVIYTWTMCYFSLICDSTYHQIGNAVVSLIVSIEKRDVTSFRAVVPIRRL